MPAPEPPLLLHERLLPMAGRQPEQPAVVEPGRVVTFGQLRDRSLSMAEGLRRLGLEPGDRVGLVMEKSADAIAVIYASLSAGCVHVPIHPEWPRERIDAALDDCEARLEIRDPGPGEDESPAVIDRRSGATASWSALQSPDPVSLPQGDRLPEDPAFILFTSGSTGPPKGVTISHRAVGAFVDWSARHFQLSAEDRIICPSPLSFDLSTFDIFNIARSGSTCLAPPRLVTWIPRLLLEFTREHGATVWYSVPSMLARLMERTSVEREPPVSLRTVLFAGEVMPPGHARRLRSCLPGADLYNLYGPTETNVVTWFRLPEEIDEGEPIPIGEPCPYARVRLDTGVADTGSGQPTGVLLVAGDSLMSGYWNRPAETARAFVQVESEGPPARYYRTGDRVALGKAGRLVFIGRVDRQVKRRGYRIELGEIEAVLGGHPGLAEVAVVASGEGSTWLAAFVRPRNQSAPGELELRAHCSRLLPPYMIPDRFVVLHEMPRGDRGKIDYGSLLRLEGSAP